ncbi:MAG: alpha/beta fold hydrolase [Usitatibacter sp.]
MRPVALHFTDSGGSGEAVVLAHAIGCDHRMWADLGPRLAEQFRVIALDARGHGKSPVVPRPYTLEIMADDACLVLEKLGIAKAHWVGLSMGGMVGQAFALRHPARLMKLVIANSTCSYGPEGRAMWQARAKLVQEGGLAALRATVEERYFSASFRAREPARVAEVMGRFVQTPVEGYLGCCDAIAKLDYADDLIRAKPRTLVIAGELDVGTPPAMSEAIAARIPGARMATIAGAAHLSAVENPGEFARLVGDFLAERVPA